MKSVFVTVGSTSFDDLSRCVLQEAVLLRLAKQNFTHMTLQHGRSSHALSLLPPPSLTVTGFTFDLFEYAPDLTRYMLAADLVISHAGAGSILEALQAGKKLIVVANETLMDNHQIELASKLSTHGHCLAATPQSVIPSLKVQMHGWSDHDRTLIRAIEQAENFSSQALFGSEQEIFNNILEQEMSQVGTGGSSCSVS